jgi:hypothetical protein
MPASRLSSTCVGAAVLLHRQDHHDHLIIIAITSTFGGKARLGPGALPGAQAKLVYGLRLNTF